MRRVLVRRRSRAVVRAALAARIGRRSRQNFGRPPRGLLGMLSTLVRRRAAAGILRSHACTCGSLRACSSLARFAEWHLLTARV